MPNTSYKIQDIGNTLKLRGEIDHGHKITNWFRQGLNVVDILPAKFKLDLFNDTEKDKTGTFYIYNTGSSNSDGSDPLKIYTDPTVRFANRCTAYGLDTDGSKTGALRLWITGESTFQEELSNEYSENWIETLINGAVSKVAGPSSGMIRNLIKNTVLKGSGAAGASKGEIVKNLTSTISSTASAVGDFTGSDIGQKAAQAAGKLANIFVRNAFSYSMLSTPKTFTSASYRPSLGFNVRLISPYGHPDAIQKFIIEPLTYLLLLSTPTTKDGITYGTSSYVSVKAYGISDMPLAIIDNISIRRGGNDVAYNKYRQPLSIDINISIKPAAEGFAAYMTDYESDKTNEHEVNNVHDGGAIGAQKIATSITKLTSREYSTVRSDSVMTTVGDVLESFKPMNSFETNSSSAFGTTVVPSELQTFTNGTDRIAASNIASTSRASKQKSDARSNMNNLMRSSI